MANTTSTPRRRVSIRTSGRPRNAQPAERAGTRQVPLGGTDGNERLTARTGLLLVILLAAQGITILRMGQLLWFHFFIGILIAGPILLKLSSAGYRFVQYYRGVPAYKRKGEPALALRMLAPLLILCTLGLLATGLTLMLLGPSARNPVLLFHKVFFVAWGAVFALHVVAHIPDILRIGAHARQARQEMRADGTKHQAVSGGRQRSLVLLASIAAGLVLAIALTGQFHAWNHAAPGAYLLR